MNKHKDLIEDLELESVDETTIKTEEKKCYKCGAKTEHLTFMAYDDDTWWDYQICTICGDDYADEISHPDDNSGLYLKCADVHGNY